MELILALANLFWITLQLLWEVSKVLIPIFFIVLTINAAMFNTWKTTFSKEGLKFHAKNVIIGLIIGIIAMIGFSQIKSWFTRKDD